MGSRLGATVPETGFPPALWVQVLPSSGVVVPDVMPWSMAVDQS
ncbi:hypothetical protein FB563_6647 [Streptomyces puniciscabiei]|uniref:Uncharacterized protein n=1 Tax=Streptomyces puniciscabiei TaxID=164348 RepID=A0A542TI78_9ACTN|nr:hypothetical protein FB563_6647 [Streptomyces puniciscabiei]